MESVANDSGLSAGRDIAWSSRVSVGSFQRSLRETSHTSESSEALGEALELGGLVGISQRASEAFHPPAEELWWGG